MDFEDRKTTLLKACRDLLQKQDDSSYIINLLAEPIEYDGCECDGGCLLEDIKEELGEEE